MMPRELPTSWRVLADTIAPFAPPAAEAFRRAAQELEASLRDELGELLTLDQAVSESGYSLDHLRHLVADGTIPNAGRKGAPRIRRADLPRRARKAAEGGYDPSADAIALLSRRQGARR